MFDDGAGDEGGGATPSDWCLPGRPAAQAGPVAPDPCAVALVHAVDGLLAQDAGSLAGPVARERARTVLAQAQRLEVVAAMRWSTCRLGSCSPTATRGR